MLFMLNINELIIIYIILNYQINKCGCEFVIFYPFIIFVVFELMNIMEYSYMLLTLPKHD